MFGNFQRRVQDWFGRLKINAGTTKAPALEIAQTWNDAGYTYTGIKANITNTASASDSLLMDLKINNESFFKFKKGGILSIGSFDIRVDGNSFSFNYLNNYPGITFYYGDPVYGAAWIFERGVPIAIDGSSDRTKKTYLFSDYENTLALRCSTSAQTCRLYSTYTSDTSYHRLAMTCAKKTLSNVSGATVVTTGGLIPGGAYLIGVTTRINTALGTGNGTTGYTVGDGSDPDLWGVAAAVTIGTATKSSDYTAADASGVLYTAAGEVTITATGGNFDATGVIEVSAFYFLCEAD